MRFEAGAACFAIGGLGGFELASQAMNLSLSIVRIPGCLTFDVTDTPLNRAAGFVDCLRPGAARRDGRDNIQ